jgi:hypothetical protein
MHEIGFDIIGELYIYPNDSFNWENKASSLYCIVTGNVSSDMRVLVQVLAHLGKYYQGVFYVPGMLEYTTAENIFERANEIAQICSRIPNVILLHQSVIVIDGIGIMGVNGWSEAGSLSTTPDMIKTAARYEDTKYLNATLEKLQRHLDVKKIILVSNAVPKEELYFGEEPPAVYDQIPLTSTLHVDTEKKVKHWVFGTYTKNVDTVIDDIQYLNNPYLGNKPYWPKRLTVSV